MPIVDDPEVRAASAIVASLEPLDSEARARVLRWAVERYDEPRPGTLGALIAKIYQDPDSRATVIRYMDEHGVPDGS